MKKDELADSLRETAVSIGNSGVAVEIPSLDFEYYRNAERIFPSTSVIKLAISSATSDAVKNHTVDLADEIEVAHPSTLTSDPYQNSGVLGFIESPCRFTIREILRLMLLVSDNVAADLLIDKLGLTSINKHCEILGLSRTKLTEMFRDSTRLVNVEANPTSAKDMLALIRHIDDDTTPHGCEVLKLLQRQVYRDRLPRLVGEKAIIWNKTGTAQWSGNWIVHDVAVFRNSGRKAYVVFLSTNRDSYAIAAEAMSRFGKSIADAVA